MWSQVSMIILRANQNSKINLIIQRFFRTLRIFHSPSNNNPVLLIHHHKDYTKRFHLGFKKGVWKVVCSLRNIELNNSIMKGAYHTTILVFDMWDQSTQLKLCLWSDSIRRRLKTKGFDDKWKPNVTKVVKETTVMYHYELLLTEKWYREDLSFLLMGHQFMKWVFVYLS